MDPGLVPGSVFKTVGLHGNHVAGGFDSHALPPNIPAGIEISMPAFFLYTPDAPASDFDRMNRIDRIGFDQSNFGHRFPRMGTDLFQSPDLNP